MLTFALIVLAGLLGLAVFVVWQLWRQAVDHATDQADLLRRQCQEMQSLRDELDAALAELDALSICPPAALAALTPDDPSLLPAEVEQWLRERTT